MDAYPHKPPIIASESAKRLYEKLYTDLGTDIITLLEDKTVNEVMLNPDGSLWSDSIVHGVNKVGDISKQRAYNILYSVAGIHGFVVHQHRPFVEAELPIYKSLCGQRFTGQIPPIVSAPTFTIRKRAEVIFTVDDYIASGRMSKSQAEVLCHLAAERKNILICGGPGSGKTTVTNALIVEAVKSDPLQRILLLEDLPELQCAAVNRVSMLTSQDVTMTALLKTAMRMRPDRILIGEVRGAEALDMLKAWNTGCPGGICTVHANGPEEAVQRILDLAMEAGLDIPPINLVHHTIDAIVFVKRQNAQKGFIQNITQLGGSANGFEFKKLA